MITRDEVKDKMIMRFGPWCASSKVVDVVHDAQNYKMSLMDALMFYGITDMRDRSIIIQYLLEACY